MCSGYITKGAHLAISIFLQFKEKKISFLQEDTDFIEHVNYFKTSTFQGEKKIESLR